MFYVEVYTFFSLRCYGVLFQTAVTSTCWLTRVVHLLLQAKRSPRLAATRAFSGSHRHWFAHFNIRRPERARCRAGHAPVRRGAAWRVFSPLEAAATEIHATRPQRRPRTRCSSPFFHPHTLQPPHDTVTPLLHGRTQRGTNLRRSRGLVSTLEASIPSRKAPRCEPFTRAGVGWRRHRRAWAADCEMPPRRGSAVRCRVETPLPLPPSPPPPALPGAATAARRPPLPPPQPAPRRVRQRVQTAGRCYRAASPPGVRHAGRAR